MPIWKSEITGTNKERVQSVGLRAFIVSFMLERGFKYGDVVNSLDGKRVSIFLECEDRKTASDFRRMLAYEIRNEARSIYSLLTKKSRLSLLEKQNSCNHQLPELSNKAPAMTLSQTSKGVGVMITIHKDLSAQMHKGFGKLDNKLCRMDKKLGKLDAIDNKLDKLPARTAKAIASVQ